MNYPVGTYFQDKDGNFAWGDFVVINVGNTGYLISYEQGDGLAEADWIESCLHSDLLSIPEGRYEIWGDNECTCGAKHTSFPSIHLTYCNIGG